MKNKFGKRKGLLGLLLAISVLLSAILIWPAAAAEGQTTCFNGDANGDGEVDILDVTLLMQYLADWDVVKNGYVIQNREESEYTRFYGDLDGSDVIDLSDVALLMRFLAGWDVVQGGHVIEHRAEQAATCGKAGCTEGVYCAICNECLSGGGRIAATQEHNWQNNTCTTCQMPWNDTLIYELSFDGSAYAVVGVRNTAIQSCTVPDTFAGLPVTSIEEAAFSAATSLTSVTLGENIVYIGHRAFWGTKLSSATIPASGWYAGENNNFFRSPHDAAKVDFSNAKEAANYLMGADPFGGEYGELIPVN